jgi:hypothetical protein
MTSPPATPNDAAARAPRHSSSATAGSDLHAFILAAGVPEAFAAGTEQALLDQHVDSAQRLAKLAKLRDLTEILPAITARDLNDHLAQFGLLTRGASSMDASAGPGDEVDGRDCAVQTEAATSRELTLAAAPVLSEQSAPFGEASAAAVRAVQSPPADKAPCPASAAPALPSPATVPAEGEDRVGEAAAAARKKAGEAAVWLAAQGSRAAEALGRFASWSSKSIERCVSRAGCRCAKAEH